MISFAAPIIMIIVGTVVGVACIVFGAGLIKRQIKLYNSITLVELKSTKAHYMLFAPPVAFLIIFTVFQMIDPAASEVALNAERLGMRRWQTNLTLGFLLFLLVSVEFLLVVLLQSKGGVVDRGIYTSILYLDWYHVHDYIIDEERCVVILTSQKDTFATLRGTTPPLRVSKNDVDKLKFILNKNKNKFSGF
ncbi:MAG: hypothetical protein LBP26_05805 [Clostridiales bacterium]|nr:hypothetical protein [Clostridiales bacterium]